jgi:hypothetical protein
MPFVFPGEVTYSEAHWDNGKKCKVYKCDWPNVLNPAQKCLDDFSAQINKKLIYGQFGDDSNRWTVDQFAFA